MSSSNAGPIEKVERAGNEVEVPMTEKLGMVDFVKLSVKEANEDHLAAFAGNLTYKWLFALFPLMVFLISLLGIFNATELVDALINRASRAMPAQAVNVIGGPIKAITNSKADTALGLGAIVSILAALWGVSGAFRSVMEAMNVMYEVEDGRPFWKKYLVSIFLSLAAAVLLITAAVLVVAGPDIGSRVADAVGLGAAFRWTWNILQWPVLVSFVLLAFALIYYFAPDVVQKFRFVSPGSILGVILWVVFSLLFSLYVNNFGSYNQAYGTLAGVAVLMLYMYYSSYILLFGAEMNQVIEQHNPEGKNEGEKVPDSDKPEGAKSRDGGGSDRAGTRGRAPSTAQSSTRGSTVLGLLTYVLLLGVPLLLGKLRGKGRSA